MCVCVFGTWPEGFPPWFWFGVQRLSMETWECVFALDRFSWHDLQKYELQSVNNEYEFVFDTATTSYRYKGPKTLAKIPSEHLLTSGFSLQSKCISAGHSPGHETVFSWLRKRPVSCVYRWGDQRRSQNVTVVLPYFSLFTTLHVSTSEAIKSTKGQEFFIIVSSAYRQ